MDGTDYLMLGAWANNRDYELASVISAMKGKIEYINNPHIAALVAAGESLESRNVHAVPNTASNQALLEAFAQRRGTTVHNKTLNVVWKTATNWDDVWQSKTGDRTPPERYDFKATYELDRDQNTSYSGPTGIPLYISPPCFGYGRRNKNQHKLI